MASILPPALRHAGANGGQVVPRFDLVEWGRAEWCVPNVQQGIIGKCWRGCAHFHSIIVIRAGWGHVGIVGTCEQHGCDKKACQV